MNPIIERNKKILKKFETMICHSDPAIQEKIAKEIVDENAPLHSPTSPEPLIGPKGFLSVVYMMRKSFSDIQWKIIDMIAAEDKVAVSWELTATHDGEFMGKKPTGKKVKTVAMNFYYINKEGKIYKEQAGIGLIGVLKDLDIISSNIH